MIELNETSRRIYVGGKERRINRYPFNILKYFIEHPERVMTRDYILSKVWPHDTHVADRVVDSHIRDIRKVMKPYGDAIECVYGVGYRFNPKKHSIKVVK